MINLRQYRTPIHRDLRPYPEAPRRIFEAGYWVCIIREHGQLVEYLGEEDFIKAKWNCFYVRDSRKHEGRKRMIRYLLHQGD